MVPNLKKNKIMIRDYSKLFNDLNRQIGRLEDRIPETMKQFDGLHKASTAPGQLSTKTKELIALGIAIAVRCDGCMAFHVHTALDAGASAEEIAEAVGVAILMGGGPSVVYGSEALQALEQFQVLEH